MTESQSMKITLIESFGLKDLLIDNFVYRPPKRGYAFKVQLDLWNQKKLFFYIINKKKQILVNYPQLESTIIVGPRSYCPSIYIQRSKRSYIDSMMATSSLKFSESNGEDGRIKILLLKNFIVPKQEERGNRILIIFSHGNASDLGDVFNFAQKIVQIYDVDILAYDYTGYGLGNKRFKPSEYVIYEDIQNVLAYAVCKLGYYLHEIILWGFSLGSCPTIEAASRYSSIGGVILQAPLASLKLWIDEKCKQNNCEFFANINKIQAIKCPILIIHGQKDSIININHSTMLYEKHLKCIILIITTIIIDNPNSQIHLIEVSDVDHNNLHDVILQNDNPLYNKINDFLEEIKEYSYFFLNYFRLKKTQLELSNKDQAFYEAQLEFQLRQEELLKLISEETSILKDQLNYSVNTSYQTSTQAYNLFFSQDQQYNQVSTQVQSHVQPEPLLDISSNHSVFETKFNKPKPKQNRAQKSALSCLMCIDEFE